jgi:hypothetical protein
MMKNGTVWISLAVIFTLSLGLLGVVLGWPQLFRDTVDIPLHDTYFVTSFWLVLAFTFLLLTYLIYLPLVLRGVWTGRPAGIILLLANGGLILLTTLLIRQFTLVELFSSGFTAYPPLSVIPDDPGVITAEQDALVSQVLFGFQLLWVISLALLGWRLGRRA